jgi:dTDP-4-dehydrorhamnose reductase
MSVAIFGAGFLGSILAAALPGATLERADITDAEAVRGVLRARRPRAVINAAGKIGRPNVDWCETHQVETYRSNVVGPLVLAEACAGIGAHLVHLGSGCIFYGESPAPGGFREEDAASPIAFYTRTKYAADLVLSQMENVCIARLRMPIDSAPGPRNLISKLASYREVIDVANSVTVVQDLVGVVAKMLERRATGIFHVTNPGAIRHARILELYQELVDPTHTFTLIGEDELVARGHVQKRRSSCLLASRRLQEYDISMRPIDIALRDAMSRYRGAGPLST